MSGIKTVYWIDQFETVFEQLMQEADTVYLNSNEHARATINVEAELHGSTNGVKENTIRVITKKRLIYA